LPHGKEARTATGDDYIRHLGPQAHRALVLLAGSPDGSAEELVMIANGFARELPDWLVLAGLVRAVTDTMEIGKETIRIDLLVITDDGRKALKE
jgi:hypothetical protein